MLPAACRSLVATYIDRVWNAGDLAALDELTTPSFRYTLGGQPSINLEGMAQFLKLVRGGFPDWHVEIVALLCEGSLVAARWQGHATHQGEFRGLAATGRRIAVCGMNFYEIADDKIAAEWEQMDSLGMLQQLGVMPPR